MIVISDTTPINYPILIGAEEILHTLFGIVYVPPAVFEELTRPKTPAIVRLWAQNRPESEGYADVEVRPPGNFAAQITILSTSSSVIWSPVRS